MSPIRNYILLVTLFIVHLSWSQTITVDDTNFSPQQMVDLLLSSSCSTNSNVNISSNQSVAYFNGNGSVFPITEGIIIRNGIAQNTAGSYTGNNLSSQVSTNTDIDLQNISDQAGQSTTITDVAFLEFDFIPQSASFSFNFLFASNEYGEWQCGFSDVFAFLLTDLDTGVSTNLAVIPGTTTPVSVRDIRDNQYNLSCNSINPELFGTYNVNNIDDSTLNMRGHTEVLSAISNVIPNRPYRIKMVIGDYYDASFDSAVFIEAGSFETPLDLGPDQSLCSGDELTIESGFDNTVDFIYEWKKDGVIISGEITPNLTVNLPGVYSLSITSIHTDCTISDEVIISELSVSNPNDLFECESGDITNFDLTLNDHEALGLNPDEYDLFYYNSIDNANNNIPIPSDQLASYSGNDGDLIYIRIQNKSSGSLCDSILFFSFIVAQIEANTPEDFNICLGDAQVDLPFQVENQILNGLDPTEYSVNYYTTESDAINQTNAIDQPNAFPIPADATLITIWARLVENNNQECFDITNFNIIIDPVPPVDDLPDIFECEEYTLPNLSNGSYFTEPNGMGTQLFPGDIVTVGMTIYIYNENTEGCSNQTSFTINLAIEFFIPAAHCGEFVIPSYPNAEFYTAPDGPDGTGTVIPADTVLTNNTTIYFYAINPTDNSFCTERQFDIQIIPIPTVEQREDVVTCDSYILPVTVNGEQYFTSTGAGGTELLPGDVITTSQDLFLFSTTDSPTSCTNETSFRVNIIDTNSIIFQDSENCGEYEIPSVDFGGFYTQAMGAGDPLPEGTIITNSQTIFYYATELTTTPNCTDNLPINITILPLPPVDSFDDILRCLDDLPELQPLVNGRYFTESGGMGTELFAGEILNTSQTIFIYNTNGSCDAESSFEVTIRPFPQVDNFTDIFSCDDYVLPSLTNGNYFTDSGGPNGSGIQLSAGDVISETQIVYIYNEYSDLAGCISENVFTIQILGIDVDEPSNVMTCDPYELPPLNVGNYFTESGGEGDQLYAGDVISTTQTLYVYAENGNRYVCSDEHEFTITITPEPTQLTLPNIEGCTSVELPILNIPDVTVEYHWRPNRGELIDPADYTINDLGSNIIYVYAFPTINPACAYETSFQVTVYPLLDLEIEGGTICIDSNTGDVISPVSLESGLDSNEFEVNWYLNGTLVGTGANYEASEAGTYRVETTKLTVDVGDDCNYNPTEVTVESSSPRFELNFLTGVFADQSTVEITTLEAGLGSYEFSLDGGTFQELNRFYNIPPGIHTILVKDISGLCGNFAFEFTLLDYPKFFTPNGDGVNDTWNITDLKDDTSAIIRIFNRFGKLVSEIKPSEQGWNGYNNGGKVVPSSDYWFEVVLTYNGIPSKFVGHFALLR